MADSPPAIDPALVRRLIREQFPHWVPLPIVPMSPQGWDNRSFRLGRELVVRLPSAERYAAQVDKEQRWLPRLAPHLPVPIPVLVARGRPGAEFPWPWSIYRWLEGEVASSVPADGWRGGHAAFAADLVAFLLALQAIDTTGGPVPGAHNFYRGGPLLTYDEETRRAIAMLGDRIDVDGAIALWEAALAAPWSSPPVWVHGDVAVNNLLTDRGTLSAVLDFGSSAVGDPACDLVIAFTFLDPSGRAVFRRLIGADRAMWARARGWAAWKALIIVSGMAQTSPRETAHQMRTLEIVLADHAGTS